MAQEWYASTRASRKHGTNSELFPGLSSTGSDAATSAHHSAPPARRNTSPTPPHTPRCTAGGRPGSHYPLRRGISPAVVDLGTQRGRKANIGTRTSTHGPHARPRRPGVRAPAYMDGLACSGGARRATPASRMCCCSGDSEVPKWACRVGPPDPQRARLHEPNRQQCVIMLTTAVVGVDGRGWPDGGVRALNAPLPPSGRRPGSYEQPFHPQVRPLSGQGTTPNIPKPRDHQPRSSATKRRRRAPDDPQSTPP